MASPGIAVEPAVAGGPFGAAGFLWLHRPKAAELQPFPPETAFHPCHNARSSRGTEAASRNRKKCEKNVAQMFDTRRDTIHTSARAGQFGPLVLEFLSVVILLA